MTIEAFDIVDGTAPQERGEVQTDWSPICPRRCLCVCLCVEEDKNKGGGKQ